MSTDKKASSDVTDDYRDVFIPKRDKTDTERFVAVNGRTILIQTNVKVRVPAEFAEAIENSDIADAAADEYITRASTN